jgi:hypothetical protein
VLLIARKMCKLNLVNISFIPQGRTLKTQDLRQKSNFLGRCPSIQKTQVSQKEWYQQIDTNYSMDSKTNNTLNSTLMSSAPTMKEQEMLVHQETTPTTDLRSMQPTLTILILSQE